MTVSPVKINSERLRADFDELAQIGGLPNGGVERLALSREDLEARSWFADRALSAGLKVDDDAAGNIRALLPALDPYARTLLIGSHLDTVPNSGRYDGSVGLLAGLECLRVIHENGLRLPVHLEVINFTDDEGCWKSLFGSRAVAGLLTNDDLEVNGSRNTPFRAALYQAGIDPTQISTAKRAPSELMAYLELHVEQGERLERADTQIGIVTHIVGRKTFQITFHGQPGQHSGTTEMYKRRDALRGAALFIVRAHELVRARYGDGIFNCGDLTVKPGKFNLIPSEACLTVEFRHYQPALMTAMELDIMGIARECAAATGLNDPHIRQTAQMPAAEMTAGVIDALRQACASLGLNHMPLISYAGHDAQIMAQIVPTGMIFIPSKDGIGHHPSEFTAWKDVVAGANVLLQTVLNLVTK